MAYFVGQLRKDNSNRSYMQKITNKQPGEYNSSNPFGMQEDRPFQDYCLKLTQTGENAPVTFSPNQVYYLRFKILKIPEFFYSSDTSYQTYMSNYANADILNLTVQLRKSNDSKNYQVIGNCNIPKADLFSKRVKLDNQGNAIEVNEAEQEGQEIYYDYIASKYKEIKGQSPYLSFSFVFSPDTEKNFDCIVFRIQRISYDAIETPGVYESNGNDYNLEYRFGRSWLKDCNLLSQYNGFYVKHKSNSQGLNPQLPAYQDTACNILIDLPTIVIGEEIDDFNPTEQGQLSKLNNIFTSDITTKWIKIGYQCRPGSLIVINKEPIRVGRSGIFELDNGLPITDFRIANPGGCDPQYIDAFLLDYAYASKKESNS